jgi:hypothetical protein
MYRATLDWLGSVRAPHWVKGLVGLKTRRWIARFLKRKELEQDVRRALAGRRANLDDIEAFVLARPVRLRVIFEANTIMLMKRGYTKGDREPERHRFFIMPRLQYRLFLRLWEIAPPVSGRQILDHFFTSYFNAWLNYQGNLEEKRWITAFAPRLANRAESVAGFFGSYPDGRLIQVLRDPKTWFPSAKSHRMLSPAAAEQILDIWCASTEAMLRNKDDYGDKVIIVCFVGGTEQTMRALARELDIAFDPILVKPTFNREPIRANSSFAIEGSGIIDAPLQREKTLTVEERMLIEERCLTTYEKAIAAIAYRFAA